MAEVVSLGVHQPTAISYLRSEGLPQTGVSTNGYNWTNSPDHTLLQDEELVTVDNCVVWSRNSVIRRIFRFDPDGEDIIKAIFANLNVASKHGNSSSGPKPLRLGLDLSTGNRDETTGPASTFMHGPWLNTEGLQHECTQSKIHGSNSVIEGQENTRRALIIILKSEAHVFFLDGTSNLVYLPFEIDFVARLPVGILLQRKVTVPIESVSPPKLTCPPQNSNPSSSQGFSSHQPHLQDPNEASLFPFHAPSFGQGIPKSHNWGEVGTQSTEQPRLFCLQDPLDEIGMVTSASSSNEERPSLPQDHGAKKEENQGFAPQEDLLYISSENEMDPREARHQAEEPLILAISVDTRSDLINFWSGTYYKESMSNGNHRKPQTIITSRRRSSRGPGFVTGATTPISRSFLGPRESFGPYAVRNATTAGTLLEQKDMDGDEKLFSRLGSALESGDVVSKPSRRVSSLLARTDLSTSSAGVIYPRQRNTQQMQQKPQKAASFGTYSTRTSAGNPVELSQRYSKSFANELEAVFIPDISQGSPGEGEIEPEIENSRAESQTSESSEWDSLSSRTLHLTKFHHVLHASVAHVRKDNSKIFILRSPQRSLCSKIDLRTVYVCLFNRSKRSMEVFEIDVRCRRRRLIMRNNKQSEARQHVISENLPCRLSRVAFHNSDQILDVCKLQGKYTNHVTLLALTPSGSTEISIQTPWTQPLLVELPSIFNLYNPFGVIDQCGLRSTREGGFKRVLSRGPGPVIKLGHVYGESRLALINEENLHHEVELRLDAKDRFVRRVIMVCEAVLPPAVADRDFFLEGWRNAYQWLSPRREEEDIDNIEWLAFLTFLFSLAAPYIKDAHPAAVRPKKKKGGLLRSSSGAYTNLESWETMIEQEKGSCGTLPQWLQTDAWNWTTRQKSMVEHIAAGKTNASIPSRLSMPAVVPMPRKTSTFLRAKALAQDFHLMLSRSQKFDLSHFPSDNDARPGSRIAIVPNVLIGLHFLREELKLDTLATVQMHSLTPVLAQLGNWLQWPSWGSKDTSYYMTESFDMSEWLFDEGTISGLRIPREPAQPPNIHSYLDNHAAHRYVSPFPSIRDMLHLIGTHNESEGNDGEMEALEKGLLPRIAYITSFHSSTLALSGLKTPDSLQETMPQGLVLSIRHREFQEMKGPAGDILRPPHKHLDETIHHLHDQERSREATKEKSLDLRRSEDFRDVHGICDTAYATEGQGPFDGAAEAHRQDITRMLFKDDQRFAEAAKLLHPLLPPTARCDPEPEWSDTDLLEAQQELVKTVALRTLSVSPGRGCLLLNARSPLLTEKFPIHGFTLSCYMKPSNTTVTADRNAYTEEKVSWAFFHAGVEAGLSITKQAKGIDTSWILFNKPIELKNRHAGFLLALGLSGHLKTIVKWVAFKYLTPKHTMTSIGLLLGLSASYLGTMDTLVTRLLSVHVTRMLPPGAAELNLSPLTQTSGIMGIGLLYCGTQHRRMSEIMLSEIEHSDQDDFRSGTEALHDESYRLAAGFALGYINLGCGNDLRGLHDMRLVERLLSMAVGNKKVSLVHALDKATPGATMALAVIFMKTDNAPLATKIDIPDTAHQYDTVRSDVFLLRTVARHLIMWNEIQASLWWVREQLPKIYRSCSTMTSIRTLDSDDMPLFNIIAGVCFSIGLRHAGSGSTQARNVLCFYLDIFMRISKLPALNYDSRLTRITVRNCQDVLSIAAASVMAGTGDLLVFRRLRSLHGRIDGDTPYGSHVATHLAIGILFLGGGTHTLNTSNLAIASLLCAFYPLFPSSVLDNKVHLQAFRHLWVLAAEPRCIVTYDVETHSPVSLPITVRLHSGQQLAMNSPCLLPELGTISSVHTNNADFLESFLDFANSPADLAAFRQHQTLLVRRRSMWDMTNPSLFSVTMRALNDAQCAFQIESQPFEWVFKWPALARFDKPEMTLVLPSDIRNSSYMSLRNTLIDDQLMLEMGCMNSGRSERLWNLKMLFTQAEQDEGDNSWLRSDFINTLKARLVGRRLRPL